MSVAGEFAEARHYLAKVLHWPNDDEAPAYVDIIWSYVPKDPKLDSKGRPIPRWTGRAVSCVNEAANAVEWALSKLDTVGVYACMSTQRDCEERTSQKGFKYKVAIRNQPNAVALKSFFIDLDVKGKHNDSYDTKGEAVEALADFIRETGLPKPSVIVDSGGGLHVHWTVSRALTVDEWHPWAGALVKAVQQHGLKCDTQVTTDAARILRIPDTVNKKYGAAVPVTLKKLGDDYSLERITKCLEPYKVAGKAPFILFEDQSVPAVLSARFAGEQADLLSANIEQPTFALVDLDEVAKECGFIRDAIATGGATYANPLWNLTTLISTFTKGGRAEAHRMANKHPGYSQASTDELFDRKERKKAEKNLGRPSCRAISGSGCATCQVCPHFTAGRSPLSLLPRKVTQPPGGGGAGPIDPLNFKQLPQADAVNRINQEYLVLRTSGNREGPGGELNALNKSAFKTAMGGRRVEFTDKNGETKTKLAADAWHDSWHRREYAGLEYCPDLSRATPGFKNLFSGWGLDLAPGDCSIVVDHIHDVVSGGDDDKANYYLDWCADILQNPMRKPGVSLVLSGTQGSGKTLLIEIKRRILGRHNVLMTPDSDRILGRFNSGIMNKILLAGEEMLFAGDKSKTDKLKHLITGHTIPVEFKFGDVLEVTSCHRLILTSNHEQVIQASSEERRYVTYDVLDSRRGDTNYFERLYAIADGRNDATAAAFMRFLLSRDISAFRPWKAQQLFANDKAMQGQKLLSLTPPLMWLNEIIDAVDGQGATGDYRWDEGLPYLAAGPNKECKWPPRIRRREMLEAFRSRCVKSRPHGASEFTGSPERFWREIHKVIPKPQTNHQTSSGQRVVSIDLADLKANLEKYLRGEPV